MLFQMYLILVRVTGLEPARSNANTSPSSWRVYQFRHRRWWYPLLSQAVRREDSSGRCHAGCR